MTSVKVLTKTEMKEWYGDLYIRSANASFDAEQVPPKLHTLIPYAEFWAVTESSDRDELFDAAPNDIQRNLHQVVRAANQELNSWLAGPESRLTPFTAAYIAFTELTLVASNYREESLHKSRNNCD